MEIKYYFLGIAAGSACGAVLGLLGGIIVRAISSTRDPLIQRIAFDSFGTKSKLIWMSIKSVMVLGALVGFFSGLFVSGLFQLPGSSSPLIRINAFIIFVVVLKKVIDQVNKTGEPVLWEPAGITTSGILGTIGGFIGIHIVLPYMFALQCLFLGTGCAQPEAYNIYDKDYTCMKQCYWDRSECGGDPIQQLLPPVSRPVDPFFDWPTSVYCLYLMDRCKKYCGIDTDEEDSD